MIVAALDQKIDQFLKSSLDNSFIEFIFNVIKSFIFIILMIILLAILIFLPFVLTMYTLKIFQISDTSYYGVIIVFMYYFIEVGIGIRYLWGSEK